MTEQRLFDALGLPPRVLLANFYPFRPGEIADTRWSRSNLFLPATQGRGLLRVGTKNFELESGQIMHVPWAAPIRYEADRRDPFVLIGLHFSYLAWDTSGGEYPPTHYSKQHVKLLREQMEEPPPGQPFHEPFILTVPPNSNLMETGIAIAHTFEGQKSQGSSPEREARMRAYALIFVTDFCEATRHTAGHELHPQAGVVREIASWMELTLGHPVSRGEMAERAGISESALAAAFRAVTGRAPVDYLIDLRISVARRMLATSHRRVGEIAASVGIPDAFYFSKLFKRRTGMSPLQYRKERQI